MLRRKLVQLESAAEVLGYRHGWPALTLSTERIGDSVTVTVENRIPPPVWFDWFVDGFYSGRTAGPTRSFYLPDDQVQIEVFAVRSIDAPVRDIGPSFSPRRTLFWIASPDPVAWYRLDQSVEGSSFEAIGRVTAVPGLWSYTWLTPRLADLTHYQFRIVPMDAGDNAGTPITLPNELIVRRPEAPGYNVAVSDTQVIFSAP